MHCGDFPLYCFLVDDFQLLFVSCQSCLDQVSTTTLNVSLTLVYQHENSKVLKVTPRVLLQAGMNNRSEEAGIFISVSSSGNWLSNILRSNWNLESIGRLEIIPVSLSAIRCSCFGCLSLRKQWSHENSTKTLRTQFEPNSFNKFVCSHFCQQIETNET